MILFPYGGNAREAAVVIEALNQLTPQYRIQGFLDDACQRLVSASYPLLGPAAAWDELRDQNRSRLLALPGNPKTYRQRAAIIERFLLTPECSLTLVDPMARVATTARIGFNTVVMAGCFVSCDTRIGNHCILLPNSIVSHDACIGDYSLVGAGVAIAGGVSIGMNCYIGAAATIREGVRIGDGAMVGMGSNVLRDVPANAVVVGNPGRPYGSRRQ